MVAILPHHNLNLVTRRQVEPTRKTVDKDFRVGNVRQKLEMAASGAGPTKEEKRCP